MRRAPVDRSTALFVWTFAFLLGLTVIACGDDSGGPVADGGLDGSREGGNPEGGNPEGGNPEGGSPEGGNEGGAVSCDQSRVGTACMNEAVPCGDGEGLCVTARSLGSLGGADDPIDDLPDGTDPETAYDRVAFADGYCAPKGFKTLSDPTSCDPQVEDSCGSCASCINLSGGADPLVMCLRNCERSWTEQACPSGNTCIGLIGGGGVCLWGACQTDDECRITRVDTNENGEIDPYDPDTNPDGDRLKYFTDADIPNFAATCNVAQGRCEHSGTPDAQAGDACTNDFECEANGSCEDGVCTKYDCDLAGNECAGDGVCIDGQCMKGCRWGVYTDDDPTKGPVDCAQGQSCVWDGVNTEGVNGGCIAGNYNDVTEENFGQTCLENSECYSPNGQGSCFAYPGLSLPRQCAVEGCGLGPEDATLCGEGNTCLDFGDFQICAPTCTQASECDDGMACQMPANAPSGFCVPFCQSNDECATGTCSKADGASVGLCDTPCTDKNGCGEGLACFGIADEPDADAGAADGGDAGTQAPGGICIDVCRVDEECPDGTVCNWRLGGFTDDGHFVRNGRCTAPCNDGSECTVEGEFCTKANDTSSAKACNIWCDAAGQCGEGEGCLFLEPGTVIGQVTIDDTYGQCTSSCASAAECAAGAACRPVLEGDNPICDSQCSDVSHCREGETCNISEGETLGTCAAST